MQTNLNGSTIKILIRLPFCDVKFSYHNFDKGLAISICEVVIRILIRVRRIQNKLKIYVFTFHKSKFDNAID